MKDMIYDIIRDQNNLNPEEIALNIFVSVLLSLAIFLSYFISHKGTIYSRKFNVSLIALTVLTATVMTVIGNNVALSLGMVGALSIVRFRTAVKDSRDTVYIFWTIICGICCGVGDFFVAAVGSAAVFLVLLVFGCIKSDNRILLIVRGARNGEQRIQAVVFDFFHRKAILRVKNTTDTNVEFIYEISDKILKKAEQSGKSITDELYRIGSIDYVNVVMQNDEISN